MHNIHHIYCNVFFSVLLVEFKDNNSLSSYSFQAIEAATLMPMNVLV
jgi:hypothetical protein